jgi:hypothetical protein
MFYNGMVSMVEQQQINNLQIGNHYIAYSTYQNDYFVIWEGIKQKIAQGQTEFYETDNFLVATYTSILKVVDKGQIKNLSSFFTSFAYGDSIVVFQERIGQRLKYYYQDTTIEFAQVIGDYMFDPSQVGNNVFAYGDIAGNYYAFSKGEFYPLLSSNTKPKFSAGLDVVAYNHPNDLTFNVFKNGEIIELSDQPAVFYQSGDNFVYFEDQSATDYVFYNDEIQELGYELLNVNIYDSIIAYDNNSNYLNIWFKGQTYAIYNTNKLSSYQVDGGILAYTNNVGGVSAFVRGKEQVITNQKVLDFWLNGNTIVLKLSPSTYKIWWNGKVIDF